MNAVPATLLIASHSSPPAPIVLVSALVIVVMDLALISYCLNDLNRRVILNGGDKRFWTAVIILGGPVGQVAYWIYGRGEY